MPSDFTFHNRLGEHVLPPAARHSLTQDCSSVLSLLGNKLIKTTKRCIKMQQDQHAHSSCHHCQHSGGRTITYIYLTKKPTKTHFRETNYLTTRLDTKTYTACLLTRICKPTLPMHSHEYTLACTHTYASPRILIRTSECICQFKWYSIKQMRS